MNKSKGEQIGLVTDLAKQLSYVTNLNLGWICLKYHPKTGRLKSNNEVRYGKQISESKRWIKRRDYFR